MRLITSGGAFGGAMTSAMLPGIRRTSMKAISVTPNRIGIAWINRRIVNCSIAVRSLLDIDRRQVGEPLLRGRVALHRRAEGAGIAVVHDPHPGRVVDELLVDRGEQLDALGL